MTYNIFNKIAPAMPKPDKGTEFVKIALLQASKYMQEVLIPMAIPAFSAHLSDMKFRPARRNLCTPTTKTTRCADKNDRWTLYANDFVDVNGRVRFRTLKIH